MDKPILSDRAREMLKGLKGQYGIPVTNYSQVIRHIRGGLDSVESETTADNDFADHNR
jgi:hypothetical protein